MDTPTQEHIDLLKSDKSLAPMFDEVYGAGASRRVFAGDMSAADVAKTAALNVIPSAANAAKDLASIALHPIDTALSIVDLGAGVLQSILPEKLVQAIGEDKRSRDIAKAVGTHYINRYGSTEGIKDAIANDPVGVLADVSTILTGGAGAVKGLAGLGKMSASTAGISSKVGDAAQMAYKAGQAIDPAGAIVRGASKLVSSADKKGIVPSVIGAKTGTGPQAVSSARQAGLEGGAAGKTFLAAMGGEAGDLVKVLDDVDAGIRSLSEARNKEYAAKMGSIASDSTALSYDPILKAVDDALASASHKGKVNPTLLADIKPVAEMVHDWAKSGLNTPMDLDKLKQWVWSESLSKNLSNAGSQKAIGNIYDSIKKQITAQAPEYANIMKNYSEASEQIADIRKTMSLSKNASADTQIRKLLSTMRDDVSSNYTQRFNIAEELQKASGKPIIPRLAGHAMSSWMPRGLMRAEVPLEALGTFAATGDPSLAAMSAASASPKLAGYTAYGAGAAQRMAQNAVGKAAGAVGGASGTAINALPSLVSRPINGVTDAMKWAGKGLYDEGLLPLIMYQNQQIYKQGQ